MAQLTQKRRKTSSSFSRKCCPKLCSAVLQVSVCDCMLCRNGMTCRRTWCNLNWSCSSRNSIFKLKLSWCKELQQLYELYHIRSTYNYSIHGDQPTVASLEGLDLEAVASSNPHDHMFSPHHCWLYQHSPINKQSEIPGYMSPWKLHMFSPQYLHLVYIVIGLYWVNTQIADIHWA